MILCYCLERCAAPQSRKPAEALQKGFSAKARGRVEAVCLFALVVEQANDKRPTMKQLCFKWIVCPCGLSTTVDRYVKKTVCFDQGLEYVLNI